MSEEDADELEEAFNDELEASCENSEIVRKGKKKIPIFAGFLACIFPGLGYAYIKNYRLAYFLILFLVLIFASLSILFTDRISAKIPHRYDIETGIFIILAVVYLVSIFHPIYGAVKFNRRNGYSKFSAKDKFREFSVIDFPLLLLLKFFSWIFSAFIWLCKETVKMPFSLPQKTFKILTREHIIQCKNCGIERTVNTNELCGILAKGGIEGHCGANMGGPHEWKII